MSKEIECLIVFILVTTLAIWVGLYKGGKFGHEALRDSHKKLLIEKKICTYITDGKHQEGILVYRDTEKPFYQEKGQK